MEKSAHSKRPKWAQRELACLLLLLLVILQVAGRGWPSTKAAEFRNSNELLLAASAHFARRPRARAKIVGQRASEKEEGEGHLLISMKSTAAPAAAAAAPAHQQVANGGEKRRKKTGASRRRSIIRLARSLR